jgi:hypothetical protein
METEMKYKELKAAVKAWQCVQDKRVRRHYQRQVIRSMNILGDRRLTVVGSTKEWKRP